MKKLTKNKINILLFLFALTQSYFLRAQTEMDAIMMNKRQICIGPMYTYSSWDHYWEGTKKRDNENLGTVSNQSVMLGANYGITNNLNVMAMAPYVWTKASAGTLHGTNGIQDLSIFVKWRGLKKSFGKNKISLFALGGFSTPLSDYVIDYLPLSIGLGSTNLIAKGMVDYEYKRMTFTGSASYVWRSNVNIDRESYYDTQLHLTSEVQMPNAFQYQLRAGYRGRYLIAEALWTSWRTLGGFDMTVNNMPFPSNDMDADMIGVNIKYTLKSFTNLAFIAGGNYTVAGRNVGQSKSVNAGIFYFFYFKSKNKSAESSKK